ncbi:MULTISPECIES: type II toxin-antitoxin system RelE family toxin [unclassified Aureimonas]|uniref:type II toxin-antitoxin system RelE family toxin n=1 Tax=unclassified Aureimonas TaxID=2615206 RepID=UPI0006F66FA7|nr:MULTISPECIES: type II toxin-antitoxin system RelE/ParE family toxin [unclassified Aureimonas]KQT64306.1 addiction module toxin RelE [Aureimonas sp. Leaf427]KQT81495.1 addiction module toxin RelE [Aureimonas sp. Leaf460]
MAWRIEIDREAEKDLNGLGSEAERRVLRFLNDRVAPLDDPRSIGEALKGAKLGGFWKYRVGDYRIVVQIDDAVIRVLVLRIGHRREIYRR